MIDETDTIGYYKGKVINIIKNSKLRWNPAPKGMQGYVVSAYKNKWSTLKIVLIDTEGNEHCTTSRCAKLDALQNKQKFDFAFKKWIEATHLPVVFETIVVPTNSSKRAICCRFINKKDEQWLPLSILKDSNYNAVSLNSFNVNKCYSGFIPIWTAKKMGLVTIV